MEYQRAIKVLENSSRDVAVQHQLQLRLKRAAMATCALMGLGFSPDDFQYCFYPDDQRRRQLHLWPLQVPQGEYPLGASMRLLINAEGLIEGCDDIVVRQRSDFQPRSHAREDSTPS